MQCASIAPRPGPCTCFLLAAVLRGGKRQFGGKVAYAGCIRNKDAVLCAHGALARQLCMVYSVRRAPFPNPADVEVWRHTPLWPGNDPTRSISYQQQADALKAHLLAADINIVKVWWLRVHVACVLLACRFAYAST